MKLIVGFSRKYHLLAKLIMFFTKSNISHSYARLEFRPGHDYLLEATGSRGWGVHVTWGRYWRTLGHTVVAEYTLDLPEERLKEAWETVCNERVGKPYGWLQLVGDAYVIAIECIFKKRVRNPFGLPWTDVCSETLLALIKAAGVEGFDHLDPETVTAEDLYQIIKGHSKFILLVSHS